MKMENDRFVVYGNAIKESHSRRAKKWQKMFVKKFNYDPNEKYTLTLEDNKYLGSVFGLKNIVRKEGGDPIKMKTPLSAVQCAWDSVITVLPWPVPPVPKPWDLFPAGDTGNNHRCD